MHIIETGNGSISVNTPRRPCFAPTPKTHKAVVPPSARTTFRAVQSSSIPLLSEPAFPMASRTLWRICLLACFLMIHATRWVSPVALERKLYAAAAEKGQTTPPVAGRRRPSLSTPVIDHDSRLVACSGKDLLAFEPNGSAAWTVPLGHRCNQGIRPVTELGKVYLVAEDNIIVVTPDNLNSAHPASAVLFSYNATAGRSEQIIGFAVSGRYSSLFVTISNRGLFVLSLHGGLRWSLGPVLDRRGYPMGCKKNVSGCYFDSAPVVGHCEGALYISNTEGQLYSLSIRSRQFRWIVDLSSLDKVMTIAPGNCGRLYILFARKSLVAGLDISTGNISWQQSIGPLSEEKSLPTVDSNGWISIGSLDGNLYSISPDGDITKFLRETAQDSVIHASPVLDCSGFSMYVAQTIVEGKSSQKIGEYTYVSSMKKKPKRVLFNLLAPATGIIHWTGKYPGNLSNLLSSSVLNDFLVDVRILPTVLSASRIGNTRQCYSKRQKIAWTCRQSKVKFADQSEGDYDNLLALMIFQFVVIAIIAVAVWFCCVFWGKKKIQGNGLHKFLEKRGSLHSKRRVLGKMISHLERSAIEGASSNETLERLGEMVKAKEGVERKLYKSYSLGRDRLGLKQDPSILPLYHGENKSHSFHSSQKESITIFNELSDTSTSEDGISSYSNDSGSCSCSTTSSGDMELDAIPRLAKEAGPSNNADVVDAMFVERQSTTGGGSMLLEREELLKILNNSTPNKRSLLRRKSTLSSTNRR